MKRLTLHIGVPKTGSTTLQSALLENGDVLERWSCEYISAPQSAGIARHNLAWEYSDDPRFKRGRGTWEQARAHIDASSNDHFLYSSEVLSRLSPEAIRRIGSVTAGLDVQVVMFVRNHIDVLESGWAGWTHSRGLDFDAWLERTLQWSSHRFYSTYTDWAEAFGGENVTVIPHETAGDAVEAFFTAAGLGDLFPELRQATRRKVTMHPHFSLIVDEIERVLGADADDDDLRRLRDVLSREAERRGMLRAPRGSLLGPSRAAEVVDRFSDEVRQLHEQVVRLPEVYFVAPEAAPLPYLSQDELREGGIRLLAGAVLRWERRDLVAGALLRWERRKPLARGLSLELHRRLAVAATGLLRALGRRRSTRRT